MTLKLNGSSSGSVAIDAPAATTGGADVTLTLPVNDGEAGQVLRTNGLGTLTWIYPAGYGAFRAYRNGNQTMVHNTFDVVEYNAETYDTQNWYDHSTNFRYTPQVAGYYKFDAAVFLSGLSTDSTEFQLNFYKNGTVHSRSNRSDDSNYGGQQSTIATDIIQLNGSSDYVDVRLLNYNSSSSNRDLNGASPYHLNWFTGYLVEAT